MNVFKYHLHFIANMNMNMQRRSDKSAYINPSIFDFSNNSSITSTASKLIIIDRWAFDLDVVCTSFQYCMVMRKY